MGHASIQMTMRYAHPTPENMQRSVDKLGEMFDKSRPKDSDRNISLEPEKLTTSTFLYN